MATLATGIDLEKLEKQTFDESDSVEVPPPDIIGV